jgi:hypothetical protein
VTTPSRTPDDPTIPEKGSMGSFAPPVRPQNGFQM